MNWVYDEKSNQHRLHCTSMSALQCSNKNREYLLVRLTARAAEGCVWYFRNTRRVRKILRRIGAM